MFLSNFHQPNYLQVQHVFVIDSKRPQAFDKLLSILGRVAPWVPPRVSFVACDLGVFKSQLEVLLHDGADLQLPRQLAGGQKEQGIKQKAGLPPTADVLLQGLSQHCGECLPPCQEQQQQQELQQQQPGVGCDSQRARLDTSIQGYACGQGSLSVALEEAAAASLQVSRALWLQVAVCVRAVLSGPGLNAFVNQMASQAQAQHAYHLKCTTLTRSGCSGRRVSARLWHAD